MESSKYLYIHNFGWLDEEGKFDFDGEPFSNTVYKAREESLFYKIDLKRNQENIGIALEKKDGLKTEGEEGEAWRCDIEVVTATNLFDLDISDKDLSMMANDVSHEVGFNPEGLNTMIMSEMKESLLELKSMDEEMFEALARITTVMAQSITNTRRVVLTDAIQWNPNTAKTTSIALSINALELYLNDEGDDTNYVLDAIYPLVIELMRQHKLNRYADDIDFEEEEIS